MDSSRIFEFDHDGVIPGPLKSQLLRAYEWQHKNEEEYQGSDWFILNFNRMFKNEIRIEKKATEKKRLQQGANERNKRFKRAERNQGNASSFAANGSRTMEGIASMPPVYYPHPVPAQVKRWFSGCIEEGIERRETSPKRAVEARLLSKSLRICSLSTVLVIRSRWYQKPIPTAQVDVYKSSIWTK